MVLVMVKMMSFPEVSLLVFFQVGVAVADRRALFSAGPESGDAPPAMGVSSGLRSTVAARAALLLLRPTE